MISFTILGEPASKANSRKLVRIKGRPASIKSDKARGFEATSVMQIPSHARLMLSGDVRVTLRIFYASRRPDLDESVILDVMQAKYAPRVKGQSRSAPRVVVRRGVYLNDRQVREKHVYWGLDRNNPRAEITVEPLEAA